MLIPILITAMLAQQASGQAPRAATVIKLLVDFENKATESLLENCLINQLQMIRGVTVRSSYESPDFDVIIAGVVNNPRGLMVSSLYAGMPLAKIPALAGIVKSGEKLGQLSTRLYTGVETASIGDIDGLCALIVADVNKNVIQRFAPPPLLP